MITNNETRSVGGKEKERKTKGMNNGKAEGVLIKERRSTMCTPPPQGLSRPRRRRAADSLPWLGAPS